MLNTYLASKKHIQINLKKANEIFIPDFSIKVIFAIYDELETIKFESDLNKIKEIILFEYDFSEFEKVKVNFLGIKKNFDNKLFNNKKYFKIIFIKKIHWLAFLSGRYLLCNMPWLMSVKQNSIEIDILRKFWSWIDYYADGGRRNSEI